jgi:hypothetical protein
MSSHTIISVFHDITKVAKSLAIHYAVANASYKHDKKDISAIGKMP